MKIKLLLISALVLISANTYSYQWSGSGEVTNIYVSPLIGGIRVKHSNQSAFTQNNTGCSNNDWIQLVNNSANEDYYEEMYSLLMALYMSGKEVSIRANGCSPQGYPSIDYISAK